MQSKLISKWWHHVLIWLFSLLVLTIFHSSGKFPNIADVVYTFYFMVSLVMAYFVNYFLLCPYLWKKSRRGYFLLSVLLITIGCSLLQPLIFKWSSLITPKYYFISLLSFWEYFPYVTLFVLLSFSLYNGKNWVELQITERKLAEAKRLQKETELLALMTQVNPHFMLNGLNTIYGMAVEKSESLPQMIMDFSDILKYNLYLGSKDKVQLREELELVSKYIDFQKFRSDTGLAVQYQADVTDANIKISPYILLPFIENAFKHCSKNIKGQHFIDISISQHPGKISVFLKNSFFSTDVKPTNFSGLGLNNVRDRLEWNYPENHALEVFHDDNTFQVKLEFTP